MRHTVDRVFYSWQVNDNDGYLRLNVDYRVIRYFNRIVHAYRGAIAASRRNSRQGLSSFNYPYNLDRDLFRMGEVIYRGLSTRVIFLRGYEVVFLRVLVSGDRCNLTGPAYLINCLMFLRVAICGSRLFFTRRAGRPLTTKEVAS